MSGVRNHRTPYQFERSTIVGNQCLLAECFGIRVPTEISSSSEWTRLVSMNMVGVDVRNGDGLFSGGTAWQQMLLVRVSRLNTGFRFVASIATEVACARTAEERVWVGTVGYTRGTAARIV